MSSHLRAAAPLLMILWGCDTGLVIRNSDDPGNRDAGARDAGNGDAIADHLPACAASGASCAQGGCCLAPSDSCLSQGTDRLCLNAVLPPSNGPECDGPASSDLSDVSLVFADGRCSFTQAEAAAGIEIDYGVVVAADVNGIHPGSAGRCVSPDASGFIVTFSIAGGGQNYCWCDNGLCAAQTFTTNPRAGTTSEHIVWDGRNWYGPSDTNNPEGAPFPPGTYTLSLDAIGDMDYSDGAEGTFDVTATRYITITP